MSDWFGMDVATEVATINDAMVALGLTKDEAVAEELLDEASARFRQVVDALVSGGKGREDSAALVRKYAAAAARMRQDRKQRELDRRAEIEAHEAEVKRLAEEAARAQAAERARLLALQAQAQAQLELLRSRRPVVHCFGGCNRTAFFWSPCTVAPRQVGWVDGSGGRYPM